MDCASSSADSSGQYFIHPLAITFICDHFTRMRLGGSHLPSTSPVIGLLFGTQNGSDIEIADATEAIYAMKDDNTAVLNIAEIEAKRKLWLEVYKEYELVGWYSVGAVSEQHMAIHQSIAASLVESPFFLLMDADALTASSENSSVRANLNRLPVMLFQAESTGRDAIFVSLDYRIKSSTYESFAVEAITKSTPLAVGVSAMEESNRSVITALDTLGDKVDAVVACLKECRGADAASKSSSEYQSFLRQVRCITSQLPPAPLDTDATAVCPETTEVDASNEAVEALLVSYMASVTTNKVELMGVAEKFRVAYSQQEGGRDNGIGGGLRDTTHLPHFPMR